MVALSQFLEPDVVGDWIDEQTLERGRRYAQQGRVQQIKVQAPHDRLLQVAAEVRGTRRYRTTVIATEDGQGAHLTSQCSCPVGWGACKHAAALVWVAAHQLRGDWRDQLEPLLTAAAATTRTRPGRELPLAELALVLTSPRSHPSPVDEVRPPQALRLARRGRSGRWLKSGFGWRNLVGVENDQQYRYQPEQVQLLRQLLSTLQGQVPYWAPGMDRHDLRTAGPGLWAVLRRLGEAGVALVAEHDGVGVELSREPARVGVDLGRDGAGDVVLRVQAEVCGPGGGGPEAGRSGAAEEGAGVVVAHGPGLVLVGEPAHGVVLGVQPTRVVLAPLAAPLDPAVRRLLVSAEPLTVPASEEAELVAEMLPRFRTLLTPSSRDGSVVLPGPARVRLRGQLSWDEEGAGELVWRWVYSGGGRPDTDLAVDDPAAHRDHRDLLAEAELLRQLARDEELATELGVEPGAGTTGVRMSPRRRFRGGEAFRLARDWWPRLRDIAADVPDGLELVELGEPDEQGLRATTGTPRLRFESSGGAHREGWTDWLELEVVVSVDDDQHGVLQIGLADVLAALAREERQVMVRRGVYVDLDAPELDRLAALVLEAQAVVDQPPRGLRLSRHRHDLVAELGELAELAPSDERVRQWTQASRRLREAETLPTPPLPAGLQATLRPYQASGYAWLSLLQSHGLGGVLADDMGLGKTVQLLAMIARARETEPGAPPFLVVAPASVVATWVGEAARFTPGLTVVPITAATGRRGWPIASLLAGRARGAGGPVADGLLPDVVVTTYTLLRLEAEQYADATWSGLVLDEAQQVKNHTSKTHAALRRITARCCFAVTGTPLENRLLELWSILALAAPGLFPHPKDFATRIAQPIESEADPEALALLRRATRAVVLRRTKELVAPELPQKQEQVLTVELSPKHRRLYDTHLQRERQRVLKLLADLEENRISILASLTRLRQLALHPGLVDPEQESVGSAKVEVLVERLAQLAAEGHRALVFSQFTGLLARVARRLDAEGMSYANLDGSTRRRAEVVEGFRSGEQPVFLISLKAGGVGLTLTEASYVFLLDPWWNPAVEAQAIDRTHRIGQTRPVSVYRLVSVGTVEERVRELSARKAALFSSVVDAGAVGPGGLDAADIADLLRA